MAGFGDVVQAKQIDRDGGVTSKLGDGFGWAIGSLDQDSNLTRTKFDTMGQPLEVVNALSSSTTYVYDLLGRQTSLTTPAGTTSTSHEASTGRLASQTDAKGSSLDSTKFVYDSLDRPTSMPDMLDQVTTRGYDKAGQMVWIEDAEGKRTDYVYDVLGRRTTTTLENGGVTTVEYDSAGRRSKITKPSGIEQRFTYQAMTGLLEKIDYYNATPTLVGTDTFSYDTYLRNTGSTGRDGANHTLTYSDLGHLASDALTYSGQTYTVSYTYDARGRLDETTYPSGRKSAYSYTNRGQLYTIDWDGSQIENRSFDALGQMFAVWREYTDEVRTYDTASRVTSIDNNHGVGKVSYTFDNNSNKLSETWDSVSNMAAWSFTTEDSGASSFTDGYDAENRFRRFKRSSQSEDIYLDRSAIGNISNFKFNSVDGLRSYSDAHELTSVAGTAQQFDDDGNLIRSQHGTSLDWDEAGLLKQVSVPMDYALGASGSEVYSKTPQQPIDMGTLRDGIAMLDTTAGTAYIMHSRPDIHVRLPSVHVDQADHLVGVRHDGTNWQYGADNSWINFTPLPDDRLLAEVDFGTANGSIDSITPLTTPGVHAQGINQGCSDTDLVFSANEWAGVANDGEVGLTGSMFSIESIDSLVGKPGTTQFGYDATGKRVWKKHSSTSSMIDVGELGMGVLCEDNSTGITYLMHSVADVHDRFASMNFAQTDHFICVRHNGSSWQYGHNNGWANFTPLASDRLLAEVDFGSANGSISSVTNITTLGVHAQGINQGFTAGDFTITANQWNGATNGGEIGLSGDWFIPEREFLLGELRRGVELYDAASGTGYLMFSVANVHSRFSGLGTNSADHVIGVRHNGTSWQYTRSLKYDSQGSWLSFTPQPGDRLIADVDFGTSGGGIDSVTALTTLGVHAQGIDQGYTSGDLTFTKNQWNGSANDGEIELTGSWLSPNESEHTVYIYAGPNCIAEYKAELLSEVVFLN